MKRASHRVLFALVAAVCALALPAHAQHVQQFFYYQGGPAPGAQLALAVDFTQQSAGSAATLPSWLSGSRSSTRVVQTSASTMSSGSIASGSLAIGQPLDATTRGLPVERGTSNAFASPGDLSNAAWNRNGTTATSGVTGPDGTASAYHLVASASAGTERQSFSLNPSSTAYQLSAWVQQSGSTYWDSYIYDGVVIGGSSTPLTTSWSRRTISATSSLATTYFFDIADSFGLFSGTPGAIDMNAAFPQVEVQPYATTYTPSTRAGERLYSPSAAAVVFGGRLRTEMAFVPTWGTAQLGQSSDVYPNRRLWTRDAAAFCEVDGTHRQVRCTIEGTPAVFSSIVAWTALQKVVIHLEVGNGVPTGWYTVNGGAQVDLGTPAGVTQPYMRTEDAALDWACDATSGTPTTQLDAYVQSIKVYSRGNASPGLTYYASTTGSGSACSKASPCALTTAQTKAEAAGSGTTVLVEGGTYYLGSTFALTSADNGITYQQYPRQTAILSGHSKLSGAWTNVSGSIWSLGSVTGPVEQLYVNGQRATLAATAITSPNSWTWTSTGFTAPDTTIAGYARPTDARVVFRGTWRFGWAVLSSVSGTTLTANATNWGDISGGQWAPNLVPIRVENAYELLSAAGQFYFNAGTSTLYYVARGTDSMGAAPLVEVGNLDAVMTVTGASGVALRGLTIEGSNWASGANAPPSRPGYAAVQAGVAGVTGPAGSHGLSGLIGPYYLQQAAITISTSTGIEIAGCTMRRFAAAALALGQGAQACTIEGSAITDVAGTGIIEGGVQPTDAHQTTPSLLTTGNVYRRNLIQSVGVRYLDSPGMLLAFSAGATVDHNTIDTTGYVGIHNGFGWGIRPSGFDLVQPYPGSLDLVPTPRSVMGNRTITGNRLTNAGAGWSGAATGMDGAAFYSNGPQDPSAPATITGNYFAVFHPPNNEVVYLDSAVEYLNITNNVCGDAGTSFSWLRLTTQSEFNTISGNWTTSGSSVLDDNPGNAARNTVSGNSAGAYGAPALAIIAASGMSVAGLPANDNGRPWGRVAGGVLVAGLVLNQRRRARRKAA